MNDLPPELQSLIEHAREGHEPDAQAKQRVRAALTLSIAAATVATTATAKGLSPLVLGLLLTGGSVAAVSVAAVTLDWNAHRTTAPTQAPHAEVPRGRSEAPPRIDTPSIAAPSPLEASEPPIEASQPIDRPHRPRSLAHDAPGAVSQATPESTSDLTDELDLVTRAAQATSTQRWSEAIVLLDQHGQRFPNGSLAEERTGLRALSLCKLGRSEGSVAAERFIRTYPSSPLIERLRASCAEQR